MFNLTRSKRIAVAYDAMEHTPNRPDVVQAYTAFKREVWKQFVTLPVQIVFTPDNPYADSRSMFHDIDCWRRLKVYQGGDLPADHPLAEVAVHDRFAPGIFSYQAVLAMTPGDGRLTHNDLFRAVHDYYGHYVPRVGFGAKGEDAAWYNHSRMFSYQAVLAMTTETRGQNSWFNEHNPAGIEPKVYAPQKAGILPAFAFDTD